MPVQSVSRQAINSKSNVTLKRLVPDATHKLCSIYPREFVLAAPGNPILPACDKKAPKEKSGEVDGIKYTFVEIHPGRTTEDKSVDTGTQFIERYEVRQETTARLMAHDAMGYSLYKVKDADGVDTGEIGTIDTKFSSRMRGFGVFVPAGVDPTKEELLQAQADLEAAAVVEYDLAQSEWAQTRKTRNISEHARVAAHILKRTPEWLGGLQSSTAGPQPKSEVELLREMVGELVSLQKSQMATSAGVTNVNPKR